MRHETPETTRRTELLPSTPDHVPLTQALTFDAADEGPRTITFGRYFSLSSSGVMVFGEPSLEDFRRLGAFVTQAASASRFWWGDFLRHGERLHGEEFSQLLDGLGWQETTARVCTWVAERVSPSTRRADLDWTHHRVVAALDEPQQRAWLARAATGDGSGVGWSAGELAKRVRAEKRQERAAIEAATSNRFRIVYLAPTWAKSEDQGASGLGAGDVRKLAPKARLGDDAAIALRVPPCRVSDGISLLQAWGCRVVTTWQVRLASGAVHETDWGRLGFDLVLVGTIGAAEPDEPCREKYWGLESDGDVIYALSMVYPAGAGLARLGGRLAIAPDAARWTVEAI